MSSPDTSWTLIDSARRGAPKAGEQFARHYEGILRAYFAARWSRGGLHSEVDDAVQEVLLDCLRERGALERADVDRPFRPFLYGVARTIALRFEQRRNRADVAVELEGESLEARETRLSVVFDRAFAVQVMRDATEVQRERARLEGGVRLRRFELLELRFQSGLTIPEIAASWGEEAARVHHMYADARVDFRDALREVVRRRNGAGVGDLERECDWMLEVLRRTND